MTVHASVDESPAASAAAIDSLAKLQAALGPHSDKPLVFSYAGREISAGYHVTEVKSAQFTSIDCGANPESWKETVVQLWDVAQQGATHMTVARFLNIMMKVGNRAALDISANLVFEAGKSGHPMQAFTIGSIAASLDRVSIALAPRPVACKPLERSLRSASAAASCCGSASASGVACCG
jgi:Family of unknown function (DUF6428)